MSCAGRRLSAARRSTGSRESDPPSTAGTCSEPERICGDGMRGAMSPVVAASGDVLLIRSPAADGTGGGNMRTTRAGGGVVSVTCECGVCGGDEASIRPVFAGPVSADGTVRKEPCVVLRLFAGCRLTRFCWDVCWAKPNHGFSDCQHPARKFFPRPASCSRDVARWRLRTRPDAPAEHASGRNGVVKKMP